MSPVRVAIVDDSLFVREALRRLLGDHDRIVVAGAAASGEELVAHLERWRPDVVTLDLAMPGWGGLVTLDRLRALWPVPVIVLSTHSGAGAAMAFEALERGAVDILDKEAYSLVDFDALRTVLVERILAVVAAPVRSAPAAVASPAAAHVPAAGRFAVVVVGASTGGPPAVERMLRALGTVAVPILVVQHMPRGFTRAFAERLDEALPLRVHEAEEGMLLRPGHVYIGPAGSELRIVPSEDGLRVELAAGAPGGLYCPSVDALFDSARPLGEGVLAVLLTGMGRDGAAGMMALHESGAHTIAQDEATCVVYGMPRAAVEAGAAAEVLPLDVIGARVRDLVTDTYERPRERR